MIPRGVLGLFWGGLVLLLVSSCGKKEAVADAATAPVQHPHPHRPPHGGTPVVLGDELYHLELVLDKSEGELQVFLLDGEMETFVRSSEPSFEVLAVSEGERRHLVFNAVPDAATGETVGDTALFAYQGDWLKTAGAFEGVVTEITLRGTSFKEVHFRFPQGNEP